MISNVEVYGLSESVRASKYPLAKDISKVTDEITRGVDHRGIQPPGTGHDVFLQGIIVQFDLTFTKQAWSELQRYHFIDFVSSQSAMHCIHQFNLDEQYIEYVDPKIIERDQFLLEIYNLNSTEENWLRLLYSSPAGLKLTVRMTTNYRQLKTIYRQRKNHRLPEWREFCKWIETLPHSDWITENESTGRTIYPGFQER